ncbi:MAG: hypothetical protein WC335_07220 [Candidatus Omnitrophota bacterium]|jgi:hypothetical protein
MAIPGAPLAEEVKNGGFQELNFLGLLKESYEIIRGLVLTKSIFRSDHASNYRAREGAFPKDKMKLLNILKSAMAGGVRLRPELSRGL